MYFGARYGAYVLTTKSQSWKNAIIDGFIILFMRNISKKSKDVKTFTFNHNI